MCILLHHVHAHSGRPALTLRLHAACACFAWLLLVSFFLTWDVAFLGTVVLLLSWFLPVPIGKLGLSDGAELLVEEARPTASASAKQTTLASAEVVRRSKTVPIVVYDTRPGVQRHAVSMKCLPGLRFVLLSMTMVVLDSQPLLADVCALPSRQSAPCWLNVGPRVSNCLRPPCSGLCPCVLSLLSSPPSCFFGSLVF